MPFVVVEVNERGNRPRKLPVTEKKPTGDLNDCSHLTDEEWSTRLEKRSARLRAYGAQRRSAMIDRLAIPKPCKEVLHWIDKYTKKSKGWKGARPSISTGIKETGLSRKRFYECIRSLKDNGLIEVVSGQDRRQTNEYRIIEDLLPQFLPGEGRKFQYAAYSRSQNQEIFLLYTEFLNLTKELFPDEPRREILTYLIKRLREVRGGKNSHENLKAFDMPEAKAGGVTEGCSLLIGECSDRGQCEEDTSAQWGNSLKSGPIDALRPTQSVQCAGSSDENLGEPIPRSSKPGMKIPPQLPVTVQAACFEAAGLAMSCGAHTFVMPDPREVQAKKPSKAVARFRLPSGEFELEFGDAVNQQEAMQNVFRATLAGFGLLDQAEGGEPQSQSILGQVPVVSTALKEAPVDAKTDNAPRTPETPPRLYAKTRRKTVSEVTSDPEYVTRAAAMDELLFSKAKQTRRVQGEKLSKSDLKKLSPKERAAHYRKQKYQKDKLAKESRELHRKKIEASREWVFQQFLFACKEFNRDPDTKELRPQDKRWVDLMISVVKSPEEITAIIKHAVRYWDLYRAEDSRLFAEPDFNQLTAEWRVKSYLRDKTPDGLEKLKERVTQKQAEKAEQATSSTQVTGKIFKLGL